MKPLKQLLAMAVLTTTMVLPSSLTKAQTIWLCAVENGAACGAGIAGSGVSNNFSVTGVDSGDFTSNIGGLTQPFGFEPGLLFSNNISVSGLAANDEFLDVLSRRGV